MGQTAAPGWAHVLKEPDGSSRCDGSNKPHNCAYRGYIKSTLALILAPPELLKFLPDKFYAPKPLSDAAWGSSVIDARDKLKFNKEHFSVVGTRAYRDL